MTAHTPDLIWGVLFYSEVAIFGAALSGAYSGANDLDSKIDDLKRQLEAVRYENDLAELKAEYDKHVPGVLQDQMENGIINTNLLENAKAGNRHAGVYKDALIKTQNHLLKSIRSHEKQVEIHMDKIAHPEKYVPDWGSKTFQERSGLLRKWNKDAQRNSEQAEIEKGTYKERFGDNP